MIVKNITIILVVFVSQAFGDGSHLSFNCKKIKNVIAREGNLENKFLLYKKASRVCNNDYEVLYNYSVLLYKNKKFKESSSKLKDALLIKDTAQARIMLSKNYTSLDKNELAENEFIKAKHREKNNDIVFREDFYNLVKKSNYEKALNYENEILNSKIEHKEDFYNLAICYEKLGNLTKAGTFLEKAIAIDNSYEKAYYNLGIIYTKQKKLKEAEKMLLKSSELNPTHIGSLRQLAKIYDKKDKSNLETTLNKIIKLKPNDFYANKKKGFLAYKKGENISALKYFKTTLSKKEDPNILNAMGMIYLDEKKLKDAKKVFSRGLFLEDYKSPKFFNNLGLTYLKQNKKKSAKQMFKKALYLDRNYKFAKNNLRLLERKNSI